MTGRPRTISGSCWWVALFVLSSGFTHANEAPKVDAGDDQNLRIAAGAATIDITLQGLVTDDGLPSGSTITFFWFMAEGPDTVFFDGTLLHSDRNITTLTFRRPGHYVIRLEVSDGALTTTDDVKVTVGPTETLEVVGQATFLASGVGNSKSKLSFTMAGVNTDDRKLDLRPNDRFVVEFGTLQVGGLESAPPVGDFVRMDQKNRPRLTSDPRQPFDGANSSFKNVKVRYRSKGKGLLTFTAIGGNLDASLFPTTENGLPATRTLTIRVQVERLEYGRFTELNYTHTLDVVVSPTKNGGAEGKG